uniref:NADH-ubiquinone oxidoreductase chain 5 n=1 Tax=Eunotia naegelii TaxID=1458866 RepID=A0A2U9GHW2_9STRA|nr:NADH dehydrogenase subunit 5 [Eunotia naegelii]AWQ64078.1 NADH dehydrogenase subunit 5 [Eunotia naegelii]
MYTLIILLPLISACFAGLFGKTLGFKGSSIFSTICLSIVLLISCIVFYEVSVNNCCVYIKLTSWVDSGALNINWGFLFDSLTITMCFIISFISFLVHLYSTEYMSHDPHLPRFMSYLSLFTFFMLILVTADNFVQMFVGWEGVGLCSFLLINFWYTRIQANKAAIKAMIINRIGDFGLVIGILLIFVNYKTLDYATVFALTPLLKEKTTNFLNLNLNLLTVIGIFLFIGVIGKSAQLGLHTWLPDAMEGPTPVSALIHAATMVTAGVFLLGRCSPIYEFTEDLLKYVVFLGSITCFFAATVGLLQNDLKKVIAYSTCSQLGYMVFVCGLSHYEVGVFHLANHAFFKALLFLGAGSVIHAILDEQDMRKMGGLKNLLPFTYSTMVIGSLALIGFPFLTGFYSKDLILEVAFSKYDCSGYLSYSFGTISAFLTTFYSTRLLFLAFLSNTNGYKPVIENACDSSYQISTVLGILAVPSIFIGFFFKDMLVGWGSCFWGNAIYNSPETANVVDSEFIPGFYKLLPIVFSLFVLICSFYLYTYSSKFLFKLKISSLGKKIYNFLNKKWFFDKIYNEYIGQFFFHFSFSVSYKIVDRGIIEILGPTGLSHFIKKISLGLHKIQTRYMYHYLFVMLAGVSFFLSIRQFWSVLGETFDYRIAFIFFLQFFFLFLSHGKKN